MIGVEKQIKKIKKRRWVFIYEVAKYYRGKYKVLNKQTLINKVVELWFSMFDKMLKKDTIRKNIDAMAKEGILIKRREVEGKDVLIIPSQWVEIANEYKAFADEVRKKIQEMEKKKNESIEVRRLHTERIREEIRRDREKEIDNQIVALLTLTLYLNNEEKKYLRKRLERIVCELKALER